jgi:hypothetical protein
LGVSEQTTDFLNENGVTFYILGTEKAVEKYNEIREENLVGALIHSTC